jgi:hypothetical protein
MGVEGIVAIGVWYGLGLYHMYLASHAVYLELK